MGGGGVLTLGKGGCKEDMGVLLKDCTLRVLKTSLYHRLPQQLPVFIIPWSIRWDFRHFQKGFTSCARKQQQRVVGKYTDNCFPIPERSQYPSTEVYTIYLE